MRTLRPLRGLLAAACAMACLPALPAVDLGEVTLEEAAQVGGQNLQLNGAGIARRLVFKVYAMGLYLPDRTQRTDAVLATAGARRMTIVPLRDIGGDDFCEAVMRDLSAERFASAEVRAHLLALADMIGQRPGGLRRGEVLTLDWVPGVGAVVALNGKPLAPPLRNRAVYDALLMVWLGEKPTDPALKAKLLGGGPADLREARL
ncbi:chalcone isomerase [Pseudorhodoferax aquiterrae]|uniref:Chalcone isomerase n=1 Tax=Pseudorhodoferax aquiterrae TaxID=747304 RepID=A0ABQ3G5W0_9BURK|nr:chalcone isomerase family protein [Pseudorhodoferax aquiterrae]GHC88921.1 chalcone isomerase [Pseudorhodoferax aquiterrae]